MATLKQNGKIPMDKKKSQATPVLSFSMMTTISENVHKKILHVMLIQIQTIFNSVILMVCICKMIKHIVVHIFILIQNMIFQLKLLCQYKTTTSISQEQTHIILHQKR